MTLREQLLKKAKSSIGIHRQVLRWQETFRKGALGNHEAYNQARDGRSEVEEPNWVKLKDVEKILAPFLEPSPQTREIQKLWKKRPRYSNMPINVDYVKRYEDFYRNFEPKLKTLFRDHVSREKLKKLIEDFPTLDFDDYNIPNTADFIEFVIRTREWRKRLVALEKRDTTKSLNQH